MLTFRRRYFLSTAILLAVEILIVIFMHDGFIRPYAGDFLVVILIYCFVRTFFRLSATRAAFAALSFAYVVEISQYFHVIHYFGWERSAVARAIFGWSFAWSDLLAYTFGILAVIIFERKYGYAAPL